MREKGQEWDLNEKQNALYNGFGALHIVDGNGNPLTRQIVGAVGIDAYRGYLDKALENAQ